MFYQQNLWDTHSTISSQELEAGPMLSALPGGRMISPPQREAAHANLSARQAREKELLTSATFGQTLNGSSISADFQSSLASKLQARLGVNGSPEYELIWSQWDMLAGPPICALRALVPRTSGKDCSGWQTPLSSDHEGSGFRSRGTPKLAGEAKLAGWPTVIATDAIKRGNVSPRPGAMGLSETAQISGYPTPTARDYKHANSQDSQDSQARRNKNSKRGQQLPNFVAHQVIGQTQSGSTAQTESAGALNPELARWLMGYPEEWGLSGATAMQ